MRVRHEKVRDLAAQATTLLRGEAGVRLQAKEDAIRVAVANAMLDNLQEEDDIEQEAERLLAAHQTEIAQGDLDIEELRHRFKREIAKRRGFRL
jgi:hypothetical protein